MITKGSKLVAIRDTSFFNKGDAFRVTDVNKETKMFSFTTFEDKEGFEFNGTMSLSMCDDYFEKVLEEAMISIPNSVTAERITEIIENSDIEYYTMFDKCTVVACRLPNGFVIVESSACVSPENYDEETGKAICLSRIADKIWELEGYKLQSELHEKNEEVEFCGSCCGDCQCYGECNEEDEELDECLDTDIDCDDCEDYDCPFNTNDNN